MVKKRVTARINAEIRKEQILDAAIQVAEQIGYFKIDAPKIARVAKISGTLVLYHFKTMKVLKKEVLLYAIEKKNLQIIGQMLAMKDPITSKIPIVLKKGAIKKLLE